jgi:hypothetical protein
MITQTGRYFVTLRLTFKVIRQLSLFEKEFPTVIFFLIKKRFYWNTFYEFIKNARWFGGRWGRGIAEIMNIYLSLVLILLFRLNVRILRHIR